MSEFPRLAPIWNGDPTYIVAAARKQLGLSQTDSDLPVLQRQVYSVLSLVADYLNDPEVFATGAVPDPVTESCIITLVESYRRREASFGIVGTYSEDAIAMRISSDWLAANCPQLIKYRKKWAVG